VIRFAPQPERTACPVTKKAIFENLESDQSVARLVNPNFGLKKLNEVRVRLAHHAVEHGKGIEVLVSNGGDEMEIFPSLKPNKHDRRNKAQKLTRLQIEELGNFAKDLHLVFDAISKLTDRMEPIFNAERKALADRIKQVKQRVRDLLWTKREFPQVSGG
jgi:hypothetical protein